MSWGLLTTILSVVGVLGVGGTIAAFIFAPMVAGAIFQKLWSGFLACGFCQVIVLVLAVSIGSYYFGHYQAASECRAEALAAELAAKNADLEEAKKAQSDAESKVATIEEEAAAEKQRTADYVEELKKRPVNAACNLTDDDLRGLQSRPSATGKKPARRPD